jgi:hypothetical protein
MEWLCPRDKSPHDNHQQSREQYAANTGLWVTKTEAYQEWPRRHFLWFNGNGMPRPTSTNPKLALGRLCSCSSMFNVDL